MSSGESEPAGDPMPTIALVRRAQGGDQDAAGELFRRYAPRVRGLVAVKTGRSLDRFVEYDDLVQEAMFDAIAKLDRFEPESDGAFICWLGRFVECRIRDTWRHHHAHRRGGGSQRRIADLGATTAARSEPVAGAPSPSQAAGRRELERDVERALLALSERYRLVIHLRFVLDMTWSEIAREMALQDGETARALFHKATRRLHAAMGSPGSRPG